MERKAGYFAPNFFLIIISYIKNSHKKFGGVVSSLSKKMKMSALSPLCIGGIWAGAAGYTANYSFLLGGVFQETFFTIFTIFNSRRPKKWSH